MAELAAGGRLRLRALVAMPDGSALHRAAQEGAAEDAARIGTEAGRALKAMAGDSFFAALA